MTHPRNADAGPLIALAVVQAAVAPLHAEPRVSSTQTSQALAGHPIFVFEERGEWLRVRGWDSYGGWMHEGYVTRTPDWRDLPEYIVGGGEQDSDDALVAFGWADDQRVSLGCIVMRADGARRPLPLGAVLAHDERLESGEAVTRDELRALFPATARAVAGTALRAYEGTPYQWGGVSPWGADCSGFVQSVFALHGTMLPRDAWQQAETGEDAGTDAAALAAGDLLFFSDRDDRRVTHVGIAAGDGRMAHVALGRGGFAVERWDADDPYVAALRERFLFARRITMR